MLFTVAGRVSATQHNAVHKGVGFVYDVCYSLLQAGLPRPLCSLLVSEKS